MVMSLILALVFTLGALVLNGNCSVGGDLLGVFKPPNHVIVSSSNTERHRRQTTDTDIVTCAAAATVASCDSSFIQNYVNAISKCGNQAGADINSIESNCRKNSRREYCGEAFIYVSGNCSSIDSSSCSTNCFNSLQQAGCCLNQGGNIYSQYLTACSIPEPSPCPKSNIRLPTLRADSSCDTLEEYQVTAFIANCDNISPLLGTLEKQQNCGITEEYIQDLCSSRNGRYCLAELNLTTGYYGGDSLGVRALEEAGRVCSSVSGCTLACNSSLNFVRSTVGCCVNSVNATFGSGIYPDLDRALKPSQWENCDISYPKKCDAVKVKWSFAASFAIILSVFWYYSNLF